MCSHLTASTVVVVVVEWYGWGPLSATMYNHACQQSSRGPISTKILYKPKENMCNATKSHMGDVALTVLANIKVQRLAS